jgi:hypothetical protein
VTGHTNAYSVDGDFNGDGVVNDLNLARANLNLDFHNLAIIGDFNHDFRMDSYDNDIFFNSFDNGDFRGDINANGQIEDDGDIAAFYARFNAVGTDLRVIL